MKIPCNVADVICYLNSDQVVEIVKESAIYTLLCQFKV